MEKESIEKEGLRSTEEKSEKTLEQNESGWGNDVKLVFDVDYTCEDFFSFNKRGYQTIFLVLAVISAVVAFFGITDAIEGSFGSLFFSVLLLALVWGILIHGYFNARNNYRDGYAYACKKQIYFRPRGYA